MTANAPSLTPLQNAVDHIRDRHVAAVNAGDAEAATGLFSADAVFLPPGQPPLEGPAIGAWFTHVFANFRLQDFAIEPCGTGQHGDIVIEHGNWKATFQPKDGSPHLLAAGTYLTVYSCLSDGSVRVIRDTFNGMPG
jgi:ketosteroid isomerase-like protein